MLSPKQYEAIGRLTIGFNEIDFLIEIYLKLFLGAREFALGEVISRREKFFQQRKDLMVEAIRVIGEEYPELSDLVADVKEALQQAGRVNDDRKRIVHGLLVFDQKVKRHLLRYQDVDRAWNEVELERVLRELEKVREGLEERCYQLSEALDVKRS